MLQHVFALHVLSASVAFAEPCSITGTTTISSYSADSTPLPCNTFTGSIAVSTDATGTFSLPGVEEIQGSLVVEAPGISSLDLRDLQKVDRFQITSRNIETISYPSLQTINEIDWAFMAPFEVADGNKLKDIRRLSVSHTAIEDLSGVFDIEMADYVFVANNQQMTNVTLPNLKAITDALEIYDNAHSGAISFPALEWAESLLITRVGHGSEWDGELVAVDFPKLEEVKGDLAIRDCPKIGKVAAPALIHVKGNLTVEENLELVEMPFESLKSVDGDLTYKGSFTRLAKKVEHTIGKVHYETDQDFSCSLHYGSKVDYEGGYYCKSASGLVSNGGRIPVYPSPATPTPTPTPTPEPGNGGSSSGGGRLKWWELFILCFFIVLFLCILFVVERKKKKRWNAAKKFAIPVVNKIPATGTSAPRSASPVVPQSTNYDDDAILPPPVTAMVPPPRYSDEFGRDAEKTALEREYRSRD